MNPFEIKKLKIMAKQNKIESIIVLAMQYNDLIMDKRPDLPIINIGEYRGELSRLTSVNFKKESERLLNKVNELKLDNPERAKINSDWNMFLNRTLKVITNLISSTSYRFSLRGEDIFEFSFEKDGAIIALLHFDGKRISIQFIKKSEELNNILSNQILMEKIRDSLIAMYKRWLIKEQELVHL